LQKILKKYSHSKFANEGAYSFGVIVAYYISIMGFYIQKSVDLATYYFLLFLPLPVFIILLLVTYKTYSTQLSRIDKLIKNLNKGESIPSIEDMIKGKAWKS